MQHHVNQKRGSTENTLREKRRIRDLWLIEDAAVLASILTCTFLFLLYTPA